MEIPPHFTKTGAGDVPTLPPVNPANSQPIITPTTSCTAGCVDESGLELVTAWCGGELPESSDFRPHGLFVDGVSRLNMPQLLSIFPTSSRYERVMLAGGPDQAVPHLVSKAAKWNEAGQLLAESVFDSQFTRLLVGQTLTLNTNHYNTKLMVQLLNEINYKGSIKSPPDYTQPQHARPFAAAARLYRSKPSNIPEGLRRFSEWDFENKSIMFVDVKHQQRNATKPDPKAASAFWQISQFLASDLSVDERTISFMSLNSLVTSSMASKLESRDAKIEARTIDSFNSHKNAIVWVDLGVVNEKNVQYLARVRSLIAVASRASVLLMLCGDLKALRAVLKSQDSWSLPGLRALINFIDKEDLVFEWEPSPDRSKSAKRKREDDDENGSQRPAEARKKPPKRYYDPDIPSLGRSGGGFGGGRSTSKRQPAPMRGSGPGHSTSRTNESSNALCYD